MPLDSSLPRDRRHSGVRFRGFDKLCQHGDPAVVQHVAQCLITFAMALEASMFEFQASFCGGLSHKPYVKLRGATEVGIKCELCIQMP